MKKQNKSFYRGVVAGVLAGAAVVGTLSLGGCMTTHSLGSYFRKQTGLPGGQAAYSAEVSDKLDALQTVIDKYYLYDDEVDQEALIEGIYKGYVSGLNEPYTTYYTKEEYAQMEESTRGIYSGIGVLISQDVKTGLLTIVNVFEGSPAEEAGMLAEDVISKVGGEDIAGQDLSAVVSRIKGKEGTRVEIEVYRASEDRYLTLDVERRTIEVKMVSYEMMDDGIGYVQITEFEEPTAQQFDEAVDALTGQGMKGLVIDLRNNPGGLVDSCVDVLDRILPSDQLVVYTKDTNDEREEEKTSDSETVDVPIVVLMNGESASASEIMGGCLQDYGKAKLVGTQSFGKGIVQYIIPLGDGSAMKLTAAEYFTPKDRNIHGSGLTPDVEIEPGEDKETDVQLDKAVEVLKGEIGE